MFVCNHHAEGGGDDERGSWANNTCNWVALDLYIMHFMHWYLIFP